MSMIESLQHSVLATNGAFTEVLISDDAAIELAQEMSALQFKPALTAAEIYQMMIAGNAKFMDRPIVVSEA